MSEKLWWKKPLRVLQTNLQVADTPLMNPEKIARETAELNANVLVVNMGGIYAWYHSTVPFHHVNEFLPENFDLMKELIDECHRRNIRVVGRFDFSKAEDRTYQLHPEWFIRNSDGSPRAYGVERPGNWSILYMTCSNSGYRNEDVAVPVLKESLEKYDIDGVFLNAPGYDYCTCPKCREKYMKLYGTPLPVRATTPGNEETYGTAALPDEMNPDFPNVCYRDNIANMYRAVKEVRSNVPMILYYSTSEEENLSQRLETTDMLCTEAQDVLSRSWSDIPPMWLPTMIMKFGRSQENGGIKPFGIIHSCPGMDWRHTGLPPAEYASWLRQIPAAGGTLWHSVTGFCDTITDKRIISAVADVDREIGIVEDDMDGAKECSDVLLLWNGEKSYGWIQLFVSTQTQFSICPQNAVDTNRIFKYNIVVLPDEFPLTENIVSVLRQYVKNGGKLIVEGTTREQLLPFADILGIGDSISTSQPLTASYWQFEPEGACIRQGFEHTPILPHRGVTAYTHPLQGTRIMSTLIPPFAPLDAVGAPPERASMLVSHTSIPLCTMHSFGKGIGIMLSFQLSRLAWKHRMTDFYRIWDNLAGNLLGDDRILQMDFIQGLITNVFENGNRMLVHIVNAVGSRPLTNIIPVHNFSFHVALPDGKSVKNVEAVLGDASFGWSQEGNLLSVNVQCLKLWEMFRVTLEKKISSTQTMQCR